MLIALEDLELDFMWVVYPGDRAYDLHERIRAVPLGELAEAWGDSQQ